MYVAALVDSIKRNKVVSIESIKIRGEVYTSSNMIHCTFNDPVDSVYTTLLTSRRFVGIVGGVMFFNARGWIHFKNETNKCNKL